ncbi:MAG: endolytic transglycosylase MltG [Paenibacillaceae bacterium]
MNTDQENNSEHEIQNETVMDMPHQPLIRPSTKLTKKNKRMMAFWTFLILICLMAGTAGGILLYLGNALSPMEASDIEKRFVVPSGISSARIASILEDQGLIQSGTVFSYYLKYKKEGAGFKAGEYAMSPGITKERIIEMMNNGEIIIPETFTFTIPEGLTITEIADVIGNSGHVDRAKFLELVNNPTLLKPADGMVIPPFVEQIPEEDGMKFQLEGYLFPETYEMLTESSTDDVVIKLLQQLSKKLSALPEDWTDQLEKNGVSFHELMTIASLVEREVILDEERAVVAGIIYNRLDKKMALQIDATVQYALDKHKERLLIEDTKKESPYNTYLNVGLPPGPIASPSINAIKAALYPEETKFLYYVTKKDGTSGHLFAETYKKHQNNIAISNKTAKKVNQ